MSVAAKAGEMMMNNNKAYENSILNSVPSIRKPPVQQFGLNGTNISNLGRKDQSRGGMPF
jgi:hypothetical protein